jgi:hypothetical protein
VTIDVTTGLVAATFAAQILVISFIVPARFRRYLALMFERYPEREFPRLYPISRRRMERLMAVHKRLHLVVGIAGVVALTLGAFYARNVTKLAGVMVGYMLVQYVPVLFRLAWTIRLARAFRAMPLPNVRTVELRQWRAVDFVSPLAIGAGLSGSGMALLMAAFTYSQALVGRGAALYSVIVNGWMLFRMLYVLFTPVAFGRTDPFMSQADVFQARRQRFRLLFVGGACLGAYFSFLLLYVAGLVRLELAYVCAGFSILCQAMFLRAVSATFRSLDRRDFSVYRAEDGIRPAELLP